MSLNGNLPKLKLLLNIDSEETNEDEVLRLYLRISEQKVLNRLYPFSSNVGFVPPQYNERVVEIAQYLYLRRGSEGETSHSENGVSRSYENADVPNSMLNDIVPMVGAIL